MKYFTAIIFSIAIVLAAYFLGNSYVRRANPQGVIQVTGSGYQDFTSDLIVWEGSFTRTSPNLEQAYRELNADKEAVKNYLVEKGIQEENIVFNSVQTTELQESQYQNGNFTGTIFKGYQLVQSVKRVCPGRLLNFSPGEYSSPLPHRVIIIPNYPTSRLR